MPDHLTRVEILQPRHLGLQLRDGGAYDHAVGELMHWLLESAIFKIAQMVQLNSRIFLSV